MVVINHPTLTVQSDWNDTLKTRGNRAWITCKEFGQTGIHGELSSIGTSQDGLPYITGSGGFSVEKVTKYTMTVLHTDPNCYCKFIAPATAFAIHEKGVLCLDVTEGGLGVSVCSQNKVRLWDTSTGEVRRELQGHVWDVYTCRFFPSGIVVLTGGADMQLKIWSAMTGVCPATLKGHTKAILDTAVVERGRNIVSVAKDGTARLWSCGEAACLCVVAEINSPINCCSIESVPIDLGETEEGPHELEAGTEGKLLAIGCENGLARGIGLKSKHTVFEVNCNSAVNCCCFISPTQLVLGFQDGLVKIVDITYPDEFSFVWEVSTSPVLSVCKFQSGFFIGRADGSCCFHALDKNDVLQLTGPDIDPVNKIAIAGDCVFTACRDGLIRKYRI